MVVMGVPNPGSRAAIYAGCTCPVIDNRYGQGVMMTQGAEPSEPNFWYSAGCPVHCPDADTSGESDPLREAK